MLPQSYVPQRFEKRAAPAHEGWRDGFVGIFGGEVAAIFS